MKKKLFSLLAMLLMLGMMVGSVALGSDYIGNSNTGKFHYADCRWVKKMSETHKIYFESREDVIDVDYVPCKVCKP